MHGDDLFVAVAPGVVLTTGAGEGLRSRIVDAIAGVLRHDATVVYRGPAVIPRRTVERGEYLNIMPHLLGVVRGFSGDARTHLDVLRQVADGSDWATSFGPTDVVLPPAACHVVYERYAGADVEALDVEILSPCFRHEPADEPTRLQSFHMLEYVHIGTDKSAAAFVERVLDGTRRVLHELGIAATIKGATDPFFGRAAMLAAQEEESGSKVEFVAPSGVAIASVNSHGDHFAKRFHIACGGSPAATACIGFGLERLMLTIAGDG